MARLLCVHLTLHMLRPLRCRERDLRKNSDKPKAEAGTDSGDPEEGRSPGVMAVWWEPDRPTEHQEVLGLKPGTRLLIVLLYTKAGTTASLSQHPQHPLQSQLVCPAIPRFSIPGPELPFPWPSFPYIIASVISATSHSLSWFLGFLVSWSSCSLLASWFQVPLSSSLTAPTPPCPTSSHGPVQSAGHVYSGISQMLLSLAVLSFASLIKISTP